MTAPLNLDALQALYDAATPGEWQFSPDDGAEIWIEGRGLVAEVSGDADRAFIAAAREAVPALIQEVRRYRQGPDATLEIRLGQREDYIQHLEAALRKIIDDPNESPADLAQWALGRSAP